MLIRWFAGAISFIIAIAGPAAAALPLDFVYLRNVDPTIRQDMRYAGSHNFIGRPVAGYKTAECILTRQAALALRTRSAGTAAPPQAKRWKLGRLLPAARAALHSSSRNRVAATVEVT